MNNLKYIPAAITAGASAYMAIHGITGWGWFLFATLIFLVLAHDSNASDVPPEERDYD